MHPLSSPGDGEPAGGWGYIMGRILMAPAGEEGPEAVLGRGELLL